MLASIILAAATLISTAITPRPADAVQLRGTVSVPRTVAISANQVDSARVADALANAGFKVVDKKADVTFTLNPALNGVPAEGYRLVIEPKKSAVTAADGAGLFYGAQALIDLVENAPSGKLECVSVTDAPRFPYRGVLIDISRHFHDKDFILKQIDEMARLNLNRLHLHLTDGAGWRLQIDSEPRLTEYAAWRPQQLFADWEDNGTTYCEQTDPRAAGGYLTKDDVREILNYAAARYITVIPEIEMPGHSAEITAAYPELACSDEHPANELCVGNEATFTFLEKVLDEVIDLFPSHYIHIGGDEASKAAWKKCPKCQARIAELGLDGEAGLQSYMIERMERYINSKGRDIIGWDEILEGGLAPNATVMSWRGTEGGIKAASMGHKAIMTPWDYCYFNGAQDSPVKEPYANGPYLPIRKVYGYNPAPDSLGTDVTRMIEGVQANLWGEAIPTDQHAEYMLYPRLIALAEVAWTPDSLKDWADFSRRAQAEADRLTQRGYKTFDLGSEIGQRPESLDTLRHLAYGKPVTYNFPWWDSYNANFEKTLTDGIRGQWSYQDHRWQGFLSGSEERVDVTIDLGDVMPITYIGADFMQVCHADVWMPSQVVISVSDDGTDFRTLTTIDHQQKQDRRIWFKTYAWQGADRARYIRYRATAKRGVLFTDEVIVR